MLYSYDIFDTLITRKTATPAGIFSLVNIALQQRKPETYKKLDRSFYDIRMLAEKIATRLAGRNGKEEVVLDEIYDVIGTMTNLTKAELEYIKSLELATEYENIIPIQKNIDEVVAHIMSGHRVVLISDMYLKEEDIRNLLVKVNIIFKDIPIYVSSEYRKKKISASLFYLVRRKEQVSWEAWIHTGDNQKSDVLIPAGLGIQTNYYQYEKLQESEKNVLHKYENDPYVQLFIGNSRNYRIKIGNEAAIVLGTTYGAAILLQYVLWVLDICKKNKISDLYFVARDGYILLKIANLLKKEFAYNFEGKYIYGSRKVWQEISLEFESLYDIDGYLFREKEYRCMSLRKLAKILGLEVDFVKALMNTDVDEKKEFNCLSNDPENPFLDLNHNSKLKMAILEKYSSRKEMLERYLEQEINSDAKQIGFVEMHGSGDTQRRLGNLLRDKYHVQISNFFFILREKVETEDKFYRYHDLFGMDSGEVIELLSRALHGRTIGYEEKNKKIVPIFCDEESQILAEYKYGCYLSTVYEAVEEYVLCLKDNNLNIKNFSAGIDYYEYLLRKENGIAFEYLCDLPMENLQSGKEQVRVFAPKPTKEEIEEVSMLGYLRTSGWSSTFSERRCSAQEKKSIEDNIEKYKTEKKLKEDKDYWYEINRNKLKKNIALYGAGKVGYGLFEYITQNNLAEITVWVDKKYKEEDGIKDSVNNLCKYTFDQIVVAVKDKKLAYDITTDLIIAGFDEKQIYWENYQRKKIQEHD